MTVRNESGPGVIVCLKWIATRPEIDPLTAEVRTDDRFSGISPADSAALEWALRVARQRSTSVTAVTVGSHSAVAALRHAIAHGASAAVHIETKRADLTSRTIAEAIASVSAHAELVLCGDHSLDRGSGSVPAFVASQLGIAQALGCVGLETDGERLVAERRLDQGRRERLALDSRTVVSFEGGLELRRAGLSAMIDAADTAISTIALDELQLAESKSIGEPAVVDSKPYRPRPRVLPPPAGSTMDRIKQLTGVGEEQPTAQQLELPPAEAAKAVVEQLQVWGYLDVEGGPEGEHAAVEGNAGEHSPADGGTIA